MTKIELTQLLNLFADYCLDTLSDQDERSGIKVTNIDPTSSNDIDTKVIKKYSSNPELDKYPLDRFS